MATSTSAILQNGDSCQSPPPPSPEAASELFLATRKKELANVAALLTAAGAGDRVRLSQETHLAAALYPHWPPSGSPARVGDTNHTRLSVLHQFASTFAPDTQSNVPHSVCGRIFAKRRAGKNLIFYSVRDETNSIQFVCSADRWAGDPALFSALHNALRRGDIVHAEGVLGRTRLGEFSVFVTQLTLLAPCWHMLPTEHAGVHNPVARYRQPYLTMLLEEGTRTTLRTRSTIVREIRDFFHRREFMEVETPMLHSIAGGAAAKPFVTTHNDLQQSMFLRVAPELDLKKLVIGGFERVFEIGKSFRNEAIDSTHHPEFTSCEAYWAYGSFEDVIAMTEALMAKVVRSVTGKEDLKVAFGTSGDESTMEIDFTPPFRRVSFIPALEKQTGEKFPSDLGTEEARAFVQALCNRHGIELSPPFTTARMLDKLASRLIEPSCINPTFLVDHPQVMSPLAKWHPEQPHRTQRFELFVAKHEVCNAYSELNHPVVQRERFGQQQKDRDSGDTESQQLDEGFCLALEYGLPPTTGWAVGIDRLCMYLTNSNNIREVIAFPANGATAQHEASNIRKISAFATATPQQSLEDDDVLSSTPSVEPSEDAPTMENGYESVEVDQSFTSMSDSATVIGLRVAEGAAFVRLDHTCFYPQGGGQPSDRGTLLTENGEFNVVKVVRNNGGVIEHQLEINDPESLPSEGSTVRLFVDASVRELHSRYHSAGHLLDVISAQLGYSWTPSSAKHFPGDAYVSYRLPEPIEKERCAELRSLLEKEANQAIIQHEEELTSEQFLTRQAAEERTGSPLSLPSSVRQGDAVRLITILGDCQPCMGTHVGRIGEIGTLQVTRCLLRRKKKENFLTLGYELINQ